MNYRLLAVAALGLSSICPGDESLNFGEYTPEIEEAEKSGHLFDRLGVLIPSGYQGELRAGYRFNRTVQRENGVSLRLRGSRTVDSHSVEAGAYYDYSRIRNAEDEVSTLTDRYGTSLAYEFAVSSPFFLRAETEWSVNRVKGIDRQVDLSGLFGARLIDRPKMMFSLAIGPGAQNQKLRDAESEWDHQGVFQQRFERQINSFLRLEQKFRAFADVGDFHDHETSFSGIVRVKLADWADALLRYSNDYTSRVAEDAPRREELLVIELAIPF